MHRRHELRGERALARLVARRADAIVCVSKAIADEMRALAPRGPVARDRERLRLRGLRRARVPPRRIASAITHAGSFFGRRDPRPFLDALARADGDVVARFVGDFRIADREYAERLGLGDRLELIPYLPRGEALALQRDSEALLLLIPEAEGAGPRRPLGKVFEYLAAERPILAAVPPDGEAAALLREPGPASSPPRTTSMALVDALADAQRALACGRARRHAALTATSARARLSRRARAEELALSARSAGPCG